MNYKQLSLGLGSTLLACTFVMQAAQAQISEGTYTISSRHSGLVLEVASASQDNGANVVQWADNGGAHQQFDVNNLGNGYYSIRPAHSGKSLDVFEFSLEPGGEIRQWDYLGNDNQQWQIQSVGSGYYKIISRLSGLALDVWEWSDSNGGDIRQWDDTGSHNQHWAFEPASSSGGGDNGGGESSSCLSSPMGFASLGGGTSGGAGGQVVTVTNGQELQNAIDAHEDAWKQNSNHRTVIRVNGTVNAGNSSVSRFDIKDMDNLSIIGVGNNGVLDGRGILLRGANNIIIRNLTIRYVRDGSGDGIEIDGDRPIRNVWIDHNTFYNTLDVDKDYYDGLIDGKNDIDNITISYNVLRDSWKTSLWGQNDSNDYDRRITFAYNRIENVNSRVPLLRFGQTHIYNNYYNNIVSTGINTRMGNRVLIENNVFENSKNPIVSCYSSDIGYWDTRGNSFNNINWESSGDCVIAGPNVGSTVNYNPPYSYSSMPASQVKSYVLANAGAGQCEL